jgi:hypothetical protein
VEAVQVVEQRAGQVIGGHAPRGVA